MIAAGTWVIYQNVISHKKTMFQIGNVLSSDDSCLGVDAYKSKVTPKWPSRLDDIYRSDEMHMVDMQNVLAQFETLREAIDCGANAFLVKDVVDDIMEAQHYGKLHSLLFYSALQGHPLIAFKTLLPQWEAEDAERKTSVVFETSFTEGK